MTQLVWIPDRRRFVGTQGEAKALKVRFEVVDVPTDKSGLMDYLNQIEEANERAARPAPPAQNEETVPQAVEATEAPVEPPTRTGTPTERLQAAARKMGWVPAAEAGARNLTDEIMALEGAAVIPVLTASIERMAETAGNKGWAAFTKSVHAWTPGARSLEQGFGMLMIAAMKSFTKNQDDKE